jgi:hypothetical protein
MEYPLTVSFVAPSVPTACCGWFSKAEHSRAPLRDEMMMLGGAYVFLSGRTNIQATI